MKTISLSLTASLILSMAGCGGGGTDSKVAAVPVSDPVITVYGSFDLSDSTLNRVLQNCQNSASQLNLQEYTYNPSLQRYTQHNFIVDGSLVIPNGCSLTGISGVITGVSRTVNSSTTYALASLQILPSSIQTDYKQFWRAVLAQTGRVILSQSSNSQITCTDSTNHALAATLSAPGDLASFFTACLL